ncbi:MAG: hypothetical protein ACRDHM_04335, partial [Actinomycetota bacterium]
VNAVLDTSESWVHQDRTAQKVGGATSTLVPMYTYHDDWYVSTAMEGPLTVAEGREVLPPGRFGGRPSRRS